MALGDLFEGIRKAVMEGDSEAAVSVVNLGLEEGASPSRLLEEFVKSVREVGDLWEAGEIFLPELVASGEAVAGAVKVLKARLVAEDGAAANVKSRVAVIGTVAGDIHDIGKSLVGTMLLARGFEVIDLGVDVPAAAFVEAVQENEASVVGISALLTTTMVSQKAVVDALRAAGLRHKIKVMVGGAPVTPDWAREIGADGTAPDAMSAAEVACRLLEGM